ncbi:pseudouridine synthase [endosymbiont GvMRE of Glomus versiforme]|uniref:pseudouridine synthase n=1 Tax=endosymbiont GvMRE of Glomus versiforme TaxID=2039283 RepID=UPI00155880E5|nr:RluA family pseudouridine synthase [endosymbiont GvMRE of Glomus versiforme]
MINFIIKKEESDQTIISFLKKKFRSTPLSLIYKLFRNKKVQIGRKSIRYYHYRLKKKEKITVWDSLLKICQPKITLPTKTEVNFEIIYEDENIILVVKEHNIEVHSSKSSDCLNNAVKYYLYQQDPDKYQEQTKSLFIINALHRLDKLTKGLVIYPKNPPAKKMLYNVINDKKKITKKYLAVCENNTKKALPNYISGYLWKDEKEKRMKFSPNPQQEQTKQCSMEIKKVDRGNNKLLLEITLHTGRKHQIRAILSYLGCPIIGDKKYESKIEIKNKIFLFAYKVLFNNLIFPFSYLNKKTFEIDVNLRTLFKEKI